MSLKSDETTQDAKRKSFTNGEKCETKISYEVSEHYTNQNKYLKERESWITGKTTKIKIHA